MTEITKAVKSWYGMIATFFTLGCFSRMPGTVGSMAACVIWLAFGGVPCWAILLVIVLGCIAADKYEKESGRTDPGECVIDEVAGYWISAYGLGMNFAVVALFAFRIIDILKPFPVNKAEKLPGGIGIMADDIVGGVIVNLLLRLLYGFFVQGGMQTLQGIVK